MRTSGVSPTGPNSHSFKQADLQARDLEGEMAAQNQHLNGRTCLRQGPELHESSMREPVLLLKTLPCSDLA